jgi:aryl-alcohol dehydrogenase-like predicted oxidoreductase
MTQNNFILGTANLGMSYGINNPESYNREDSRNIINHSIYRGITTFDTAAEYGIAESLIGEAHEPDRNFKVITKIPRRDAYTYEWVNSCLESSLHNLQQEKIYGLMFHDPDINKKTEIQEISKQLIESGKIEHIGFSAYTLEALLDAKEKNEYWNIFQVPENILDRRLAYSPELDEMAKDNNYIFVRSIFLQGLLLRKSNELPRKFLKHKKVFQNLEMVVEQLGVTILDLCLSYASSLSWNSGTIVAAASKEQLDQILDFNFTELEFNEFDRLPYEILDPRFWRGLT